MTNDEIKTFNNMLMLLPKIEIKDYYSEEDYFNIFQLIDGYRKELKKYFINSKYIDELLDKKYGGDSLYSLIRLVRNRVSHVEKNNAVDKFITLTTIVDKDDIHTIINEIKSGVDYIFVKYLNNDIYKVMMNNKLMIYIFELTKAIINNKNYKNEFDQATRPKLKELANSFNYDDSTINDYNNYARSVIELYQTKEFKEGIIAMYGEGIYDNIMRFMTNDSITLEELEEFIEYVKTIKC